MKKLLLLILAQVLLCTLIFGGGIIPPKQDPNNPKWVKGEILVKFKDDVKLKINFKKGIFRTGVETIDELISKWKISDLEKVFKNEEKRTETKTIMTYTGKIIEVPQLFNIYKLKFSKKTDVKEIIADFEKKLNIEYAEPNYIARICVIPDDPSFANQWGLHNTGQYHLADADIDAPEAWDIEIGDSTVIIGIIDTGVDWGHPDLTDNIFSTGYDFVNNDDDAMDDNGHGTHVAGIAAATPNNALGIAGVAWNCKILPVKVLQSNGYGTYSDVASGVNYAANNGAKVINLSLGGYASSYVLQNALENAYTTSVIVAAAGNGSTSAPFYPASWSFVIGAGASDVLYDPITQTWYEAKAVFSNYGINADLYAPGVNIFSTIPLYHPHTYSYTSWNGSSMAAPFVTGTVALLRSHYSDWSNELIHGQLVYSSDVITGGIRLNAYKSLTEIAIPQLNLYSHSITDTLAGCDQDGIADAGETVEMIFDIQNTWGQAYNVETKLSYHSHEDTCFVTIVDSISTFGGASSYAHVNNESNPFVFFVKNSTPNNTDVYFDYEINCDTGHIFTGTFYITTERGIEIGGIIWSDETWTNDYLYIVTSNSLVDEGVTLTIEAGTRIQFCVDKYLRIDGCLVAIGTEDSMIVFTSNAQNPAPGDWGGIRIGYPDTVKYAEVAFGEGIKTSGGSYIAYNWIHDNTDPSYLGGGVWLKGNSVVEYNLIQRCGAGHGSGGGIALGGFAYDGVVGGVIRYNIIEESSGYPYVGGIYIGNSSPSDSLIISHNVIRNNYSANMNNYTGGIYFNMSYVSDLISITNNTLYGNGNAITFSSTGSSNNFFPVIKNNTIIFNKYGIRKICNRGNITISNSNILHQSEYNIYNGGSSNISATHNYWGTTSTDSIDTWIWDYYDDFDLGKVLYQPFETIPITTAPGFLYQVAFNPPSPIGCETDTFNLTFSKPMDISIQPNVKFGVCEPYTQHIIEGVWIDSTNWQGTYTFGIMTGDGINNIRVTTAEDCEAMEIPKDTRFSFVVDATGASSVGFIAQAGIGKVDLEWNGQDMMDLMGYNMYRCHKVTDTTYSDTTLINTSMITDTIYCDMSVIPNTHYKYMYTGISTDFIESDYSNQASATPFDAANGDANGDLAVNVLDITTIVSYMLNQNPSPFLFDAADVNYDNDINVLDIIGLVQLISGDKTVPLTAFVDISDQKAFYEINDNKLLLESEGNLAAMQFKFKVQGLKAKVKSLKILNELKIFSMAKGFEFAYGVVDDHIIGILYSLIGKEIPAGDQELFRFEGVDISEIEITEIFGGELNGNYVPVLKKGEHSSIIANEAELQVNPNPFSNFTYINYTVPENGIVNLRLFDLTGAEVNSLINTYHYFGNHTIKWNGTNSRGQLLKPGIYILQLKVVSVLGNNYNKEVKVVFTK